MDHDRLCSWLGLSPGAWPPDHYALLGLARGTGDFADIEARVLDRMEWLRQHQLLHPDAVTAGMNRLAQALVCLTDPVARAAYDRGLGIAPAPFELVEDEPLADDIWQQDTSDVPTEVPFEPGLRPPGKAPNLPYEVVEEPDSLPYAVVPDNELAEELPAAFEVVPDSPKPGSRPPRRPAPAPPPIPIKLRTLYKRLAALRQAIRAWERLRPVMGNPTELLATPIAVLLFLRALTEARDAIPRVAFLLGTPRAPGGTVTALVRLPHALDMVRELQPVQRQAVAVDWRRGYDALRYERDRLRARALANRSRRRARTGTKVLNAFRRTPELALIAVAITMLFAALIRRNS